MPEKKIINIDIDGFRNAFLGNIQRLQDHVRACLGGLETLTAKQYADAAPGYVFIVSPPALLDLEEAREFSQHWLTRSFFRDAVDQLQVYLDHCYDKCLVMELAARQPGASTNKEEAKRRHGRFQRLGLPAKFNLLQTQFQLKTDLRAHVETINAVRNCLVHRLGVVRADDVDDNGVLTLKLRRYRLHVVDASTGTSAPAVFGTRYGDARAQSVFDDSLRTFCVGEHIRFDREELFDCTHTMAAFDQSMAVAFGQLATRFGIPFGPARGPNTETQVPKD